CRPPDLGRFQAQRTADEPDAPVAQGHQVLHGLVYPHRVVHDDVADVLSGRPYVQEHHRHLSVRQLLDQVVVHLRGHYGNPVDLALQHAPDADGHARRIVIGGTHQDVVAMLRGNVFQTRWAVSASTRDGLLMVRDTVDVDTRARRATSWMVRLSGRRCEGSVTGLTARLYLGCRPQSRGEMKFCEQYIEKPLTPSCDLA